MALSEFSYCPVCNNHEFKTFQECTDHFVSGEKYTIKECTSCQFKITDNIPDEESIGKYYQSEDYISHSDTSAGLVNRVYHVAREFMLGRKRKIVATNSINSKGKLLDIGAGTGYFAAHMKNHGWDVSGTEKSSDARAYAKKELNTNLVPSEDLFTLEGEQFDAITLWHVMEHFYNLQEHIEKIKQVLKNDGTLFIALPNHTSFDAEHYKEYWAAYDVPRHIWHFGPKQLKKIFENNGFNLVKKYRMPLDSFYISMMSEKYKKSKLALFKGVLYGSLSWFVSLMNKNRCSSLIYILKKN